MGKQGEHIGRRVRGRSYVGSRPC